MGGRGVTFSLEWGKVRWPIKKEKGVSGEIVYTTRGQVIILKVLVVWAWK